MNLTEKMEEFIDGLVPVLQTDYHRQKHRETFKAGVDLILELLRSHEAMSEAWIKDSEDL